MKKEKLPNHERLVAVLIVAIFLSLSCLNIFSFENNEPIPVGELPLKKEPLIQVTITGAVREPGIYQVERGTTVREAIQMAGPFETAIFGRMRMDSKILRKRKIVVREKNQKK